MPRAKFPLESMTPGQVAKRWGVSVDRIQGLVRSGRLAGAFRIPSVGRYGETVRIPLSSVLEVEKQWAIAATESGTSRPQPSRRNGATGKLKHFPELIAERELDAECPEDAPL